jgi:hypothetical protein
LQLLEKSTNRVLLHFFLMIAARHHLLGLKIAAPTLASSIARRPIRSLTTMSASSYKYVVLGGGNAAG